MYPKLVNSSGVTLAILNNVSASTVDKSSDGIDIYDFAIKKDGKDQLIVKTTSIIINDQEYNVIKKINKVKSDGTKDVSVKCEHVSNEANDFTFDTFAFTGTATQILAALISATGASFTVGTVATTGSIVFARNEKTTLRYAVSLLASTFNLEVEYDNKVINMPVQIGSDNGVRFQAGKNLKGITYTEDYLTDDVSISVNVVEVSKTEDYKTGKIKIPDNVSLGDIVRVYTDEINLTTRVVRIKYDPIRGINQGYVLSTQLDRFTKASTNQKFSTVLKGRPIYGIDINSDDGLEIERTDLFAKARFNADELRFQTGDGIGNYTDAIYFDILSGKYKFIGDIEASGTITGADFIGGTINIGSGTFTVDAAGNVIANSLTIGGGSGIGNLSDAGSLATLDEVDTVHITNDAITAPKINVTSLSAINADLGTVNAGTINGATINGTVFRSSLGLTDERLEISAAGTKINWYDSGNSNVSFIDGNFNDIGGIGLAMWDTSGNKVELVSFGDMDISSSDGDLQGFWQYDGVEIVTTAGNGLDKNGKILDIDPSEIAGNGLQEDGANNLEIDENVVITSLAGQDINMQHFTTYLEVRDGTTYLGRINLV